MTTEEMKNVLRADPELLVTAKPFVNILYRERYNNAVAALSNAQEALSKLAEAMDVLKFIQEATDREA